MALNEKQKLSKIPTALKPEQQVCKICGKSSEASICHACADKVRAEAVGRKKREDRGQE